jgi:hypothetical protein
MAPDASHAGAARMITSRSHYTANEHETGVAITVSASTRLPPDKEAQRVTLQCSCIVITCPAIIIWCGTCNLHACLCALPWHVDAGRLSVAAAWCSGPWLVMHAKSVSTTARHARRSDHVAMPTLSARQEHCPVPCSSVLHVHKPAAEAHDYHDRVMHAITLGRPTDP